MLEGFQRVLVERRDEDEMRTLADVPRDLHAAQARHVHIQETDVRLVLLEQLHGLAAVAGLGHDLQLRPGCSQPGFQDLSQQRLVVRNEGSGVHGVSQNSIVA